MKHRTARRQHHVDFSTVNCGSIVLLTCHSPAAKRWADAHIESEGWQWLGTNSLACEPRYMGPLLDAIREEGLTIG